MAGARVVGRKPEEVRRSAPIDPDTMEALHGILRGLQVELPTDHGKRGARATRALFATIRISRNKVGKVVSKILPRLAELRADLVRVDQVIAAEEALAVETGHVKGKNAEERKASLRGLLREWHETRASIKADLHLAEEVFSHAKWTRDELRFAFEEASRGLAVIELEERLSRAEA